MKLFGFNIGSKSEPQEKRSNPQTFSAFFPIGKENLSLPYIDSLYTLNGVTQFGSDNLYPQKLNQLYFTSPIHTACIDFTVNAIIGGGYAWDTENDSAENKVEKMAFEKLNNFNKLSKLLTRDWLIHKRITVEVTKRGPKTVKLRRLDPETIRNDESLSRFMFSSDWRRGYLNSKEYVKYTEGCKETVSLYVYYDESPGVSSYPLPNYNSALNWIQLDGEQAYFHKNNLQNSIFPSLAIRRPKDFQSIPEIEKFKTEISDKTGAANAGKVIVLTGNGFDDVPEIVPIPPNTNDKLFDTTSKELKENISIAHKINPAIMGIKTAGQLGATTEIQDSYVIYEKNVVKPERETIECVLNELISIAGVTDTVTINNYQIVEGQIVEVTEQSK
jgi:hypothetical protein